MKEVRYLILAFAILCVGVPAQAFLDLFSQSTAVTASNGMVSIPVSDMVDGKARYYRYSSDTGDIKFFLVKSSDGVIRAAFDACDVCFHAKKGYSQDKDFMVCNNCGMKFHSSRINEVSGGCNPSPLKRTIQGDIIVISVADIMAGKRYFQ